MLPLWILNSDGKIRIKHVNLHVSATKKKATDFNRVFSGWLKGDMKDHTGGGC